MLNRTVQISKNTEGDRSNQHTQAQGAIGVHFPEKKACQQAPCYQNQVVKGILQRHKGNKRKNGAYGDRKNKIHVLNFEANLNNWLQIYTDKAQPSFWLNNCRMYSIGFRSRLMEKIYLCKQVMLLPSRFAVQHLLSLK
jgi:hypothetical protein